MRDIFKGDRLLKIILLGAVIVLSGLYPLPKAVSTSLGKAYRAQQSGSYPAMAANFARLALRQPWRAGLWEAAGDAALAAGDTHSATVYFSYAAAKGELSPDGYLAWGDADWQAEKPQTALQIWEIAARQGVSQDVVLHRKAEAYRAIGDDLSLIETLQAILQQPSTINGQQDVKATLYYELGLLLSAYDPETAPIYLKQAAEIDPSLELQVRDLLSNIQDALSDDDPVHLLMISGQSLANHGHWDLAAKAFENVITLRPGYAEAWAYLGEAWQHSSLGGDPLMALIKALELDPASTAANTFAAFYWQRGGQYEAAIGYLRTAAELDPENPTYLVEIGNLMALSGDLDAGKKYHWQAIALSGNDPIFVHAFIKFSIQYHLDLREMALPLTRQLLMRDPDDPVSLDLMGEILFWLGDMLNAERFFLRALEQVPAYDQAHLHLGNLYRSQGKQDLAVLHYEHVLEVSHNALTISHAQEMLNLSGAP